MMRARQQQANRHQRNPRWRRDRRWHPPVLSPGIALASMPSLPRPILCRLTARMITEGLADIPDDAPCLI